MRICRILGHKFRPRHHEHWSGPEWLVVAVKEGNLDVSHPGGLIQDHSKTYLYDMCVRCGSTTEGA